MNLQEEIEKLMNEGYSEANASARVCQDIILYGISNGSMSRNVTIKGGVVMRNISKNARRATQDIDLDFIRYSISEESIKTFIGKLYMMDGVNVTLKEPIIELRHKDYKGKRVFLEITDEFGNKVDSKIDIGVHKDIDVTQEEYCFDICYLSDKVDKEKLIKYIQTYIFDDNSLPVNSMNEISKRIERVFTDTAFISGIKTSRKNWMDISIEEALKKDIEFIKTLIK
jgi:hypothetical protein